MSRALLVMREKAVELMILWDDVCRVAGLTVISWVQLERRTVAVCVNHSLLDNTVIDVSVCVTYV